MNRKRVQRVFHMLNWNEPAKAKNPILRSSVKVVRASRPYQFWQTDLTYIWCGDQDRWSYLFNVLDVFHREWLGYAFERSAVKEHAIMSVNNALASHDEAVPGGLTLRCDNGPQYTSRAFKDSMDALGLRAEHILYHTPEQNGYIESFHKDLEEGIHLDQRLPEPPGGRDRNRRSVRGLQPSGDSFVAGVPHAVRVPGRVEAG
ncbi:MAG: transposase family protein [Nitrososphaerota archaeon]|nr:transposase family protein [Nitrososphaerota archaeon]